MPNPIEITPRWKEIEPEVALQINDIICCIASARGLVSTNTCRKLLKHMMEHHEDLCRLGMFEREADNRREKRREKRMEAKFQREKAMEKESSDSDSDSDEE